MVVVGGEITTKGWVDVDTIARKVIADIGYTKSKYGFNAETCAVLNVIGKQSPDISQGVDVGGAGDQGLMAQRGLFAVWPRRFWKARLFTFTTSPSISYLSVGRFLSYSL